MINWDEFEHIHVIRKLKQILGSWWNIDVIFTDERGHIKGLDTNQPKLVNHATEEFLSKETARTHLQETVAKTIEDLRTSDSRFAVKKWDTAGFDIAIFPINIENDFVGTVIALGFLKDQEGMSRLNEIKERLAVLGTSTSKIETAMNNIQYIDDKDRQHFLDLVELVAQEVVTLHLEITSREDRIRELNKELGSRYKYENMIGKSKPMQNLYALLDKIRTADSTVLIQGDNGTGKELIAKAIHYNSNRKDKAFIVQNCSAFNDNLLESELFGHVKGSFTGAIRDKKGLFELADKGTFFLDEIGDTSPTMQVKLLRVLQEGTFTLSLIHI